MANVNFCPSPPVIRWLDRLFLVLIGETFDYKHGIVLRSGRHSQYSLTPQTMNQRHSSILSLWLVPGLVGLLLRLTGAWSGMGPFAADDYTFGIEWGYTWFLDSEASFDSAFRSPLMGQFIAGAMTLGHFLGFRDPIVLLQFAYCLLGVASVGCIPAAYTLASEKFDAQHGKAAAWLVAVFPLMPRITTRGLIGVVAMLPILWGFVWLERSLKSRDKVSIKAGAAAVLVGLGALVRYQVGILYVAVLVALVVRRFYGDKKDVFREISSR